MSSKTFTHLHPAGEAVFRDSGITKVGDIITSMPLQADETDSSASSEATLSPSVSGIGLVGVPLSKPSISHSGASFAPQSIRQALFQATTYAIEEEVDLQNLFMWDCGDIQMHVTDITESHKRIRETAAQLASLYPSMIPIFLGGDHSISCPSLQGWIEAQRSWGNRVGVIQFDAHHDLRNTEDGGPSNGTPFRGLIQSGTLKGNQLVQIGIRSFSNSKRYHQYAQEQGVRVFTMKDVRERQMDDILTDALAHLKASCDIIYLSVDMDVLDQSEAPGCPAIGPGGMASQQLLASVRDLAQQDIVQGMDIVEIDPTKDFRDMTSRLAAHVILQFLVGYAQRQV
ncbi:formimidoylglutamase [Caldalkalibacillus salinus]|uniref:formimidoylglutamase n=1 Tax=Caldalkalibacillus salinus TaxID=2803787 RepID=UPI001F022484|nr:formimidoylglutamase [Caldalkalibacillus salinus]